MTRFQIEQVQAVLDLADARLRNPPLDPNVEHDLREIVRLARLALGAAALGKPCDHQCTISHEEHSMCECDCGAMWDNK